MESKTNRYQSRILREMHQNNDNPFNSPLSSTGSHGTVSLTSDLDISIGPAEGESTRRFDHLPPMHKTTTTSREAATSNTKTHTQQQSQNAMSYNINTSVLGRHFPEWKSWSNNANAQAEPTDDIYNVTGDHVTRDFEVKENIPPSSSTIATPEPIYHTKIAHQPPTVEELQPEATPSPRPRGPTPNSMRSSQPRRANVTTLIQTLKTAQFEDALARKTSSEQQQSQHPQQKHQPTTDAPKPNTPAKATRAPVQPAIPTPATGNHTARSFFIPSLAHINDFVSGTLRWSSMKNGVPVFVKHGKVHDRESLGSPSPYADVDGIALPEEEEKIFVSMDKIRDEIRELKEHDEQVSKQAEQLNEEVQALQSQLSSNASRKGNDFANESGSTVVEYLTTQKTTLEKEVTSLQSRLDQVNRKMSINEIHTESFATERDDALKKVADHRAQISRLEVELKEARTIIEQHAASQNRIDEAEAEIQETLAQVRRAQKAVNEQTKGDRALEEHITALEEDNRELVEENEGLVSSNKTLGREKSELERQLQSTKERVSTLQTEYTTFRRTHRTTTSEKIALENDNQSLERQNEQLFAEKHALERKNELLERRSRELWEEVLSIKTQLNNANDATGTLQLDAQDARAQLEDQNRALEVENADLHQEIIDMKAELASERAATKQEKRRLASENARLSDQLVEVTRKYEKISKQNKKTETTLTDKYSTLTQQVEDLLEREAALTTQLNERTEREATTTQQTQRTTRAVDSARALSREVADLAKAADKAKPVKTARIAEPVEARSKTNLTQTTIGSATSQSDLALQDDYTREVDVDQLSVDEPVAPAPTMRRTQSDETSSHRVTSSKQVTHNQSSKSHNNTNTTKNTTTTKHAQHDEGTGRFSVKSGFSDMSLPSQVTRNNVLPRRHSDTEVEVTSEERNMTSAFFIDDITMETDKQSQGQKSKKAAPALSKNARRVLDNLCDDHSCKNCIVCVRVNGHTHEDGTTQEGQKKKRTVRIERPVPVTDRMPKSKSKSEAAPYEDQPTMRPSQDPSLALAKVIKGLKDEEIHLKSQLAKAQSQYDVLDPSLDRRQHKLLSWRIDQLQKQREMKRDQLYHLYDVVEGQKIHGQEMTAEDVEMTIMSVMSKDATWNGIVD